MFLEWRDGESVWKDAEVEVEAGGLEEERGWRITDVVSGREGGRQVKGGGRGAFKRNEENW